VSVDAENIEEVWLEIKDKISAEDIEDKIKQIKRDLPNLHEHDGFYLSGFATNLIIMELVGGGEADALNRLEHDILRHTGYTGETVLTFGERKFNYKNPYKPMA